MKIAEVMGWEGSEWFTRQWRKVLVVEFAAEAEYHDRESNTAMGNNNDDNCIDLLRERSPMFAYLSDRWCVSNKEKRIFGECMLGID